MEFKNFPLYDALGVITCSKISLGNRFIASGKMLDYSDISALRSAGYSFVSGAKLSSSDVVKSTAITKIASVVAGENTAYYLDDDNRCFIYAEKNGIANINQERINRFNNLGLEVILATAPVFHQAVKGQLLAVISIIPPAITEDVLQQYLQTTFGMGALVSVLAYKPKKVYFIQSSNPKKNEEYEKNILTNITARLDALGVGISYNAHCEHLLEKIENEISKALYSDAEIIIISGAVANYHKEDVLMKALVDAGADIIASYIPSFPSANIIIADYKKHKQIVVLPEGCDKSDYNAVDLILKKLVAGYPLNKDELFNLGAGGLLAREVWQPIDIDKLDGLVKVAADENSSGIAAIILAAGKGSRIGGDNKLLYEIDDETIVTKVVKAALASKASPVIVVTGFEQEFIADELKDKDVKLVYNSDYASGINTSIRTGLESLNNAVRGAIIIPADMPFITSDHLNRLIDAFDPLNKKALCVSTYKKVKVNPALWARKLFDNVKIIPENAKVHPVLVEHSDYIAEVPLLNDNEALDINTKKDIDDLMIILKHKG